MVKKVLICSNEERIRESLKLILSDHYSLILFESPEQIEETSKNSDADILLLDVDNVDDGMDLGMIKTIIISNNKNEEKAKEYINSGALKYILKPIKVDELLEVINES